MIGAALPLVAGTISPANISITNTCTNRDTSIYVRAPSLSQWYFSEFLPNEKWQYYQYIDKEVTELTVEFQAQKDLRTSFGVVFYCRLHHRPTTLLGVRHLRDKHSIQ